MKTLAVIVLGVIVVAARIWARRHRRSERAEHRTLLHGEVALVAAREARERLRGRLLRVVTGLLLLVVAGAIVIPILTYSKATPYAVGVVGRAPAGLAGAVKEVSREAGVTLEVRSVPSAARAESGLRAGRLDVVVDGATVVYDQSTSGSTQSTVATALADVLGQDAALAAADLSPSQRAALDHARSLAVLDLAPAQPVKAKDLGTGIIGLVLTFMMLTQYLTWTLMGVMEEKTSRVVEVLLATVRPLQLLAGKVLGIATVAVGQATLVVGFALVLADAVGSSILKGAAPTVLAAQLGWLVLGYAFYCWVYAAAGSMVERQDQVQSMALPLSVPLIFGYVMGIITISESAPSLFFKVLAYLPPTAPFAMPVLVTMHAVAWWQFALSAVVSVGATVLVARLAATIYRRAILRTGRRVKLSEVMSSSAPTK